MYTVTGIVNMQTQTDTTLTTYIKFTYLLSFPLVRPNSRSHSTHCSKKEEGEGGGGGEGEVGGGEVVGEVGGEVGGGGEEG